MYRVDTILSSLISSYTARAYIGNGTSLWAEDHDAKSGVFMSFHDVICRFPDIRLFLVSDMLLKQVNACVTVKNIGGIPSNHGGRSEGNHYENMPIQIYRNFHLQKIENFQIKNSDIFHTFAQNIDCWYSIEPPRRGGSNEYPQSMF